MKYRKKPVVIEAFQMTFEKRHDPDNWPDWLVAAHKKYFEETGCIYYDHTKGCYRIATLEGTHDVTWDDWIIQGVQGELYPCKPDIFAATYEAVGD